MITLYKESKRVGFAGAEYIVSVGLSKLKYLHAEGGRNKLYVIHTVIRNTNDPEGMTDPAYENSQFIHQYQNDATVIRMAVQTMDTVVKEIGTYIYAEEVENGQD